MYSLEKKGRIAACVLAGIASVSLAQTATVGFVGRVVNTTCSVAVRGASAAAYSGALHLPPVSALPARVAGETFGRTAFALGVDECAGAAAPVPLVSITSPQAVGGYIASGVRNLLIEVGTESIADHGKQPQPLVITQTPHPASKPDSDRIRAGFYIQYRAAADTGTDTGMDTGTGAAPPARGPGGWDTVAPTIAPTITINLSYV